MKKIFKYLAIFSIFILGITGCTETTTKDENGVTKKEFSINETAIVNDRKIKINSVQRINSECLFEYNGICQSENKPDNNYFLLIDLTIENLGEEEVDVSSIMSFELKDKNGEKGEYELLTKSITSQLDSSIMPNDLLKGQIVYDVKDSDEYYFYYKDSLIDDSIKFTIKKSDIMM